MCDTIFHNLLIFIDNLNTGERTNFDDLWNEIKNVKSDHPLFQDNESTDGNQTHCDSSRLRWTYYNSLFFSLYCPHSSYMNPIVNSLVLVLIASQCTSNSVSQSSMFKV